jgi:hypothetical protein
MPVNTKKGNFKICVQISAIKPFSEGGDAEEEEWVMLMLHGDTRWRDSKETSEACSNSALVGYRLNPMWQLLNEHVIPQSS